MIDLSLLRDESSAAETARLRSALHDSGFLYLTGHGVDPGVVDRITQRENGLDVLEVIADISARVVVNRVSMKMKAQTIMPMLDAIRAELAKRNEPKEEVSSL